MTTEQLRLRRAVIALLSLCWLATMGMNLYLFMMFLLRSMGYFALIGRAYTFNTIFVPLMFVTSGSLAVAFGKKHAAAPRRWVLGGGAMIAMGVAAFGLRVYATNIEPNRLVLREVVIHSPKVTAPLRILHISDIQSDHIDKHEQRAVEMMRELHPDIVVHTGDLIQTDGREGRELEVRALDQLLKTLQPPHGKMNVFGDVDAGFTAEQLEGYGGMKLLHNDVQAVETPAGRVVIAGLSLNTSRRADHLDDVMDQARDVAGDDGFLVVMGHAPDFILSLRDRPPDLCLAGHTHGGQIRLPWLGAIMWMSAVPRDWARGYHEDGDLRFNVSAGIGAEHRIELAPIRFLCPPEMTLITVTPD